MTTRLEVNALTAVPPRQCQEVMVDIFGFVESARMWLSCERDRCAGSMVFIM